MESRAVRPYEAIRRKRDGLALEPDELRAFFEGYAGGEVGDYQMAAFLMAVHYRGLSGAELDALVDVMLHSGVVLSRGTAPPARVDKHSTGGVGDKVSLVLAPLVASLGVAVPMMSGRGLGHTGGTADKLEAIPGFRASLDPRAFQAQIDRVGCALAVQTDEIAPLDRRLYALRDVTATVESIPLIAASIMSKKLAEGLHALVLDVKQGNGAFIPEPDRARELARTMIRIGAAHGVEVLARLTAMDRPLGWAVGNALEVEESIFALRGEGPPDLLEVTLVLAADMLVLGGVAADERSARAAAERALRDGRALEKLRAVIDAQGGNAAVVDDPAILPQAPVRTTVVAGAAGRVTAMDVRAIGAAAVELGVGRSKLDDVIDPAVGFHITVKPGDEVAAGEPLATVFASNAGTAATAARRLLGAIRISSRTEPAASPLPLIGDRIAAHHPADAAAADAAAAASAT